MPKYSPVAPIQLLEQLYVKGRLGNYLLFLAHDVLENMHSYHDLINDLKMKYEDDLFIIMDNGVIERGAPVSIGGILEAANIVDANCIVAPDVVGDLAGTKKLMMDRDVALIRHDFDMMFVPQGKALSQVYQCIDWMDEKFPTNGSTRYWGIPRWIANEVGSRVGPILYINTYLDHGTTKIHLLGMSSMLEDDIRCAQMRNVMGIDSANPLVAGHMGMFMGSVHYRHYERGDFWKVEKLPQGAIDNINWVRHAIGSHY